jgi:hypothetical protein
MLSQQHQRACIQHSTQGTKLQTIAHGHKRAFPANMAVSEVKRLYHKTQMRDGQSPNGHNHTPSAQVQQQRPWPWPNRTALLWFRFRNLYLALPQLHVAMAPVRCKGVEALSITYRTVSHCRRLVHTCAIPGVATMPVKVNAQKILKICLGPAPIAIAAL